MGARIGSRSRSRHIEYACRSVIKSLALGGVLIASPAIGQVVNSQWQATGGGSWNIPGNWTNGIPDSVGSAATFGSSIGSASAVTLDGTQTLSSLTFNNGSFAYTLATGNGGTLVLQNTGTSSASMTDQSGAQFITAPVLIDSSTQATVVNSGDTLSVSNATLAGGSLNFSGTGTLAFGAINVSSPTSITVGNTTFGEGALNLGALAINAPVEFNGPVSSQTSEIQFSSVSPAITVDQGNATYGLNDFAYLGSVSSSTNEVLPGSSVPAFYSPTSVGSTGIHLFSGGVDVDQVIIGGNPRPENLDIVGTGQIVLQGGYVAQTIRFNTPNGGLANVNGNNSDLLLIAGTLSTTGILVTPNVGANDIIITADSTGSHENTQDLTAGEDGTSPNMVVWQNNTAGLLVWSTGLEDSPVGPVSLTTEGQGTVAILATSTYTGSTTIEAGAVQIQSGAALGSSPSPITLNGGSLVATESFALHSGGATPAPRGLVIGANGANLSAAVGDVFTVDGNISGTGNLTLGSADSQGVIEFFTVASANPFNSTINFSTNASAGLVVLSGNNTYSGNTMVQVGSLQTDGSYTTGNFTVNNGANMSGVPSLPANSSVTVHSGATFYPGDNGIGAFTVGTLNLNSGSSLAFAFSATALVDPIQVNNSLAVTGTPSSVNLYLFQEFTTGRFQTSGTYALMQVPNSSLGSLTATPAALATPNGSLAENSFTVDGFTLANPQILTTYALSANPIGGGVSDIDLEISSAAFGTGWNSASGGTWANSGNWLSIAPSGSFGNPPIPNGAVDTAIFGPVITAPATITVDASPTSGSSSPIPVTVGNIIFDSSIPYTIAAGSSANLTLSNGQSAATIVDQLGQHTISVPLVMSAGLNVEVVDPTDVLTINGPITGTGNVIFAYGQGTLVLANTNNSYTGNSYIAASSGVLQLGNGTNAGNLGNSGYVVNQGNLVFNEPAGTYAFANAITGTGALIQTGTGSEIVLTGSNTYTGPTAINANTAVQVGTKAAANFSGIVQDSGLLDMNGQSVGLGSLTGAGTVDNVTAGGSATLSIGYANTTTTFSGVIRNTTGTVSLSKQGTGTLVLAGVNTYGGPTTVGAGSLVIGSTGGLPAGGTVVDNGTLSIQAGSPVAPVNPAAITGAGTLAVGTASTPAYLRLGSTSGAQNTTTAFPLTVAPGSTLDLTNNTVVINYLNAALDPEAAIRADLARGYNNDTWTGPGITSSVAASNPGLYAVGYTDGNIDQGTPAAANQIIIENALAGDANLDGTVNFSDLLVVAQNFNHSLDTNGNPIDWADGDFNYDGKINFADLLLVAQNFNKTLSAGQLAQLPTSFAADWQLAEAEVQAGESNNVPEPATVSLLAIGAAGLLARRRRATLRQL